MVSVICKGLSGKCCFGIGGLHCLQVIINLYNKPTDLRGVIVKFTDSTKVYLKLEEVPMNLRDVVME